MSSQDVAKQVVARTWWDRHGKKIFWALKVTVIVITVKMTLLMAETLLPALGAFKYLMPAVFDIGVLAWDVLARKVARSAWQRQLSVAMFGLSMGGVLSMITLELLYGGQKFVTPPVWAGEAAIFVAWVALAANFVALVAFEILEPEVWEEIRSQRIMDAIERRAYEVLEQQQKELVTQRAAALADALLERLDERAHHRIAEVQQRTRGNPSKAFTPDLEPLPAMVGIQAAPGDNHHGAEKK